MPSTVGSSLQAHLEGETTNLATLWKITRDDGETFFFTDHDENIVYDGDTYLTGLGYNRSAIEDKADLSVDNLDIDGVLDTSHISKEDVRGGRFDRARVEIIIVNWKDLTQGGIIKRAGYLGEVRQNNNGEFQTELRGLTQALSEQFVEQYTPGCRVDLGSPKCGVPLDHEDFRRQNDTTYGKGKFITIEDVDDVVFRAKETGTSAPTDNQAPLEEFLYAIVGDEITDGSVTWVCELKFTARFIITSVTSRRLFTLDLIDASGRWDSDSNYFDGGTILFNTGNNSSIAKEVEQFDFDTANGGEASLFLRMPFEVQVGDTGVLYPGCSKGIQICASRFANSENFRGFPHIPGDKYLKDYPDTK